MHTDTEHVQIPQHKNFKTVQLTLNHKPRELKGEKTETKTKIKKKKQQNLPAPQHGIKTRAFSLAPQS